MPHTSSSTASVVPLLPKERPDEIELTVQRTERVVRGRVEEPDGTHRPQVRSSRCKATTSRIKGRVVYHAFTKSDGRFVFDTLPPGGFGVVVIGQHGAAVAHLIERE